MKVSAYCRNAILTQAMPEPELPDLATLFVLAYNLGNSMRRLALPEAMKHWSLTSLQTRMIKTGGRLVRHARRLVFQLAEVLVSREMLGGILERIGRLRLAPG